jgi:hypothetical protein
VLRSSSSEFCPVQELEKYINYCSDNGLDMYLCTMDRCGLHNLYEMCLDTLNNLFLNKGGARFGRVAIVDCSKRIAAK